MLAHDLDPGDTRRSARLTQSEYSQRRSASDNMLSVANPLLDHLFALVCGSGCGVFLSDGEGVVLDHRCGEADSAAFERWNLWSGAHWGEAHEGTNGIGTCRTEGRRLMIHRGEHFALRNTAMSCMDAPIHGPQGDIVGALDISSARSDQTVGMSKLMFEAVGQTARQIEGGLFRSAFPGARIVVADPEGAALLAVDSDDVVIGANRAARRLFGLPQSGEVEHRPAVDLLGGQSGLRGFDRGESAAIKRALLRHGGNVTAAARDLGIGRATFYRKLKKLGLDQAEN